MFQFKACPKCRGALRTETDRYGKYSMCMQCGYLKNHAEEVSPTPLPSITLTAKPEEEMEPVERGVSPVIRPRAPRLGASGKPRSKPGKRRFAWSPWTMWY